MNNIKDTIDYKTTPEQFRGEFKYLVPHQKTLFYLMEYLVDEICSTFPSGVDETSCKVYADAVIDLLKESLYSKIKSTYRMTDWHLKNE